MIGLNASCDWKCPSYKLMNTPQGISNNPPGVGMGIMPSQTLRFFLLFSFKRLQYLKDVNMYPWSKRQQNLLRLVILYWFIQHSETFIEWTYIKQTPKFSFHIHCISFFHLKWKNERCECSHDTTRKMTWKNFQVLDGIWTTEYIRLNSHTTALMWLW